MKKEKQISRIKCAMTWLAGFTLAEVLITLGVIGIVAALTMPALIANYQKKVVITRLQKFYSTMQQGINTKIAEDGAQDCSMFRTTNDADEVLEFWNVNYAPYVKTVRVDKGERSVKVAFPDGSGMFVSRTGTRDGTCGSTYFAFSPNYKVIENILEETPTVAPNNSAIMDCKTVFAFGTNNNFGTNRAATDWESREDIKAAIEGGTKALCARLIQVDGWEIKDDYPW